MFGGKLKSWWVAMFVLLAIDGGVVTGQHNSIQMCHQA
jgi:hypothetical protein